MKLKPKVVLDEEFMSKYDGKNPFPNEMAGFTYARTYSQWLEEHSRREKWQETVKRVAEYSSSLYQGPSPIEDLQKEIHEMFDSVFSLNWLPAGRTLWSGGTKHSYENGGLSQFNCSFVALHTIESFYELMYALCLGVGVGFSVEKIHTSKLPNFNKNRIVAEDYKFDGYDSPNYLSGKFCNLHFDHENKTLNIKIPDSKEGWADGVRQILTHTSQLSGYTITVNLNSVRPEGDRIRGFGGKASGPTPYVSLLRLFDHILNKKELDNFKLEPIDVLDICNGIAKIIVAGGVRRSAQLCLFDEGDQDIVSAKMNFWNNEFTSHRNMSNNSIHFWTMPTMENLLKLIDPIKNSYEPGLYNALTASKRRVLYYGSNPCCFSGNTRVLTSNGYYQIQDLLDKEVEVWNGMEWSKVTPYYAGHHDTVVVALSDGTSLRCTPNHKFVLKGDLRVEADDLKIGDKLEKFQFPIIDADQKNDPVIDAYSQGFYSGDGNADMTKSWIYQPKYLCIPRLIGSFGDETIYNRKTWTHGPMLDKRFVPINASLKYKLNWLAGLFDADGCAVDSPNSTTLQLASIDHDFLMDLKLLLTTLGCSSKVMNAREAKQVMMPNNKGCGEYDLYNCKQIWRILINTNQVKTLLNLGIKFNRLNIAKSDSDRDATRFVTVVGVTESTPDDVYCFSDPLNGTGTFEGVVTSNSEILLSDKGVCNLVTVVISRHVNEKGEFDMDKLRKSFKGATRHCLRITNTDLELPEWDKVQKRDRLLGVSMTGCEDAFDMTDTGRFAKRGFDKRIIKTTEGEMSVDRFKKKMNEIANKEARDYAFEMRVPSPLLVCTIKPEGTLSILAGVSSGAHKNFGTTYRRRVRINRFDALAKVALEMGLRVYPESGQGYLKSWDSLDQDVKKMILDQANTWVVEFPIKTGAKSNAFDESANSQLSRYLSYQNCYADHSTSITISVADDEWVKLFKRIYKHWDLFIGISFQNKSNDKYDLAPYELMTQDEYEYEASQIKSVNMFELLERAEKEGMMAHEDLGSDCVGGACPIR